jgi:hypothetical protein
MIARTPCMVHYESKMVWSQSSTALGRIWFRRNWPTAERCTRSGRTFPLRELASRSDSLAQGSRPHTFWQPLQTTRRQWSRLARRQPPSSARSTSPGICPARFRPAYSGHLGALHAGDPGRQFGRQQAVVGCLGGQLTDRRHPHNDRRRPEAARFQGYRASGFSIYPDRAFGDPRRTRNDRGRRLRSLRVTPLREGIWVVSRQTKNWLNRSCGSLRRVERYRSISPVSAAAGLRLPTTGYLGA